MFGASLPKKTRSIPISQIQGARFAATRRVRRERPASLEADLEITGIIMDSTFRVVEKDGFKSHV